MVTRALRRFLKDQAGIALTEGLIVFPMMVLAISVCIEFGYMVNQWNFAAKGMQLAARKLVVSAPAVDQTVFNTTFNPATAPGGTVTPISGPSLSCRGDQCANATLMNYLVVGGGSGSTWPGLRNYFPSYPQLETSDVRVTYSQTGLGYYGRPTGPVVTVRLDVARTGVTQLPVVRTLLDFAGISFPPFTVTVTSEDLCNGNDRGACG